MSIKLKLNLLLLVLGIISSISIAFINYYDAKNRIFNEALRKAELMSSFAMAARTYTVKTMRPLTMKVTEAGSFHPELMGGFFVARAIADIFAEAQPGYSFKQAALNPVNFKNQATPEEVEMVSYLSDNRSAKLTKGLMEKNGQPYFYVAQPVVVKKGCLKCHDTPENALPARVERYPNLSGYGYKVNEVVAAFVNYVPIQKALEELKVTAMKTVGVGICSIFVILLVIWYFMNAVITKPIIHITGLADSMSRGKNLDKEVVSNQKGEIGALYNSFNRMRKSVVMLIKMNQKKKS